MFNYNFNTAGSTQNPKFDTSVDLGNATLKIGQNNLVLSEDAIKALGIKPGDRININYYAVDEQLTIPLITVAYDGTGNRLTKSNTVSFRGRQGETLSWYGRLFKLGHFNSEYFRLIPQSVEENIDLTEEENDLLNLN